MNGATLGSIRNRISIRRTEWITGSVSRPTVRTDQFSGQPRGLPLHGYSLAKNRRADAYDGCAFFDRDFVIVRHAHRKLAAQIAKRPSRTELVAQLAQLSKERPDLFGIIEIRRQGHQSRQSQTLTVL